MASRLTSFLFPDLLDSDSQSIVCYSRKAFKLGKILGNYRDIASLRNGHEGFPSGGIKMLRFKTGEINWFPEKLANFRD